MAKFLLSVISLPRSTVKIIKLQFRIFLVVCSNVFTAIYFRLVDNLFWSSIWKQYTRKASSRPLSLILLSELFLLREAYTYIGMLSNKYYERKPWNWGKKKEGKKEAKQVNFRCLAESQVALAEKEGLLYSKF